MRMLYLYLTSACYSAACACLIVMIYYVRKNIKVDIFLNRAETPQKGFLLKNDNGQSILADLSIGLVLAGIIMIMVLTIIKSASDSQAELLPNISSEENEVKY